MYRKGYSCNQININSFVPLLHPNKRLSSNNQMQCWTEITEHSFQLNR
jgi:hypothetical protein